MKRLLFVRMEGLKTILQVMILPENLPSDFPGVDLYNVPKTSISEWHHHCRENFPMAY